MRCESVGRSSITSKRLQLSARRLLGNFEYLQAVRFERIYMTPADRGFSSRAAPNFSAHPQFASTTPVYRSASAQSDDHSRNFASGAFAVLIIITVRYLDMQSSTSQLLNVDCENDSQRFKSYPDRRDNFLKEGGKRCKGGNDGFYKTKTGISNGPQMAVRYGDGFGMTVRSLESQKVTNK